MRDIRHTYHVIHYMPYVGSCVRLHNVRGCISSLRVHTWQGYVLTLCHNTPAEDVPIHYGRCVCILLVLLDTLFFRGKHMYAGVHLSDKVSVHIKTDHTKKHAKYYVC